MLTVTRMFKCDVCGGTFTQSDSVLPSGWGVETNELVEAWHTCSGKCYAILREKCEALLRESRRKLDTFRHNLAMLVVPVVEGGSRAEAGEDKDCS